MIKGRLSKSDLVSSLQTALQKCEELHGNKCQVVSPKDIPDFWIIDTQKSCLVPGNLIDKYAALSYVWASPLDTSSSNAPSQRLSLQRSNLGDFRRPGFISSESGVAEELPQVIRDSMDFVQRSGVRYLWVGCLCIPQNDENTGDNVLYMREIYSGAYFTIIAAAHSSGLYWSEVDIKEDGEEPINNVPYATDFHRELLETHWATRGWTFQEQMLSTRSFVFLDATAFWDCQDAVWWSKSLIRHPGAYIDELGSSYKNKRPPYIEKLGEVRLEWVQESKNDCVSGRLSRNLRALTTPDLRLYTELICRYNYRDLTYPQDALLAISGVLDALMRGFSGGFISGLPAIFLDSALLWQPLVKAKRRVRSDDKLKSSPPLPSWSWAGWQCRIDPESLQSALDYEVLTDIPRGAYGKRMYSWRTRKLVDWISSTTTGDESKILEPGILEEYKEFRDGRSDKELPDGWSHITADTNSVGETESYTSKSKGSEWYSHKSSPKSAFRYPVPMAYAPPAAGSHGNKHFISCTTVTAKFNVRRVLYPHQRMKERFIKESNLIISVLETQLYKNECLLETCCPVITLEDNRGRWAGVLRVMDDNTSVKAQETVEVVAISQGSSTLSDAALAYEETVDRLVCYRFGRTNITHCHFTETNNFQNETVLWDKQGKSECYKMMEKEADSRDQGPFFRKDLHCRRPRECAPPKEWKDKSYEFYNVLWVERRGDFMERKAAGRVPKEIWEQNQGELQNIRLC
ncbi:heterokaryon incompatibility protein-domain-containing protein [Daldinia eschscholtzii]|nr:heterokaryon incompatibility protein-domain-containing protein [Daldinia eschscholtzii]